MSADRRFARLSDEQLQGADFALRLLLTSPLFRGLAAKLLADVSLAIRAEMRERPALRKDEVSP